LSGAYLGYLVDELDSLFVGVLTFYLVSTGWMTSKRKARESGLFEVGALIYVLMAAAIAISIALGLWNLEPAPLHAIAGIAALFALGDVHMILRGGLPGAQRIARHLWRMGLAFFVAVLSVTIGRPQLYPEPIRDTVHQGQKPAWSQKASSW